MNLTTYDQAIEIIEGAAKRQKLSFEKIALEDCVGKVCYEDVLSPEDVPSFNNSAMDGFLIKAEWTRNASQTNPVYLPVHGIIAAGDDSLSADVKAQSLPSTLEIMTGAKVPESGFDSVIKIEDVNCFYDNTGKVIKIEISRHVLSGENMRLRGEDFKKDQLIIKKDTKLSSEHILALAALGVSSLCVYKRLRVAVLSTGRELVHYSQNLHACGIRNSTGPYLQSVFQKQGCDVKYSGFVSDDPYEFKKIIHQTLDTGIDIIITTGAVSMGKYDFVARSLEELGVKKHFHNVAIRPGKPLYFGEFSSGEVIFGVPGNPISTVVAFRFFVLPYIYHLLGLEREKPILAKNVLPFSKPHGFRCFYKAKVHFENAEVYVQILKHQASFMVSSLLEANAWAVIPEEKNKIDRDEKIEVIL